MKWILLTLILLWMISTASATDYYVNDSWPGASDSNDGLANSNTSAWLTIQQAADTMVAGDTVYVQNGTYNEKVTSVNGGNSTHYINFIGSGEAIVNNSGSGESDGVFYIEDSYINITGFNISAYSSCGVYVRYNYYSHNLNISDNYIWTDGERGVFFHANSGNYSIISNNEIHTDYKPGVNIFGGSHTNITISHNDIYTDENFKHKDYTNAPGIWVEDWTSPLGIINNISVLYNNVWNSGYTGIKIGAFRNGSGNCTINYNTIGPNGFVHNGIEMTMDDSEIIGNKIYDTNLSWAVMTNAIYCPGAQLDENLIVNDNIIDNSSGRALTTGGKQRNILFKNLTVTNFTGIGIEVMGYEGGYPLAKYTSADLMFVDASLEIAGASEHPITLISLGTREDDGNFSYDYNTFINPTITGTYAQTTWWLTNQIAGDVNKHFEGIVSVINSNKDDVLITKDAAVGTFDGEIIFYYHADIQVVGTDGNPIEGATVTFTCNNSSMYARNVNYTYEDFPGTTQNINNTITEANGHTPNSSSDDSNAVVIADFRKNLTATEYFEWNITVSKDGYDTNNSVVVNSDNTWYRSNPDNYQNTTTIILSGWSFNNDSTYEGVKYRYYVNGTRSIIGRSPEASDKVIFTETSYWPVIS